jgi:hypothetical protein
LRGNPVCIRPTLGKMRAQFLHCFIYVHQSAANYAIERQPALNNTIGSTWPFEKVCLHGIFVNG